MVDDKEIKGQINEYYKLLEDLKAKMIVLEEEFVAGLLIEKLFESWNDYKNQFKHKHKQLSLEDLVVHIIIEETNCKELQSAMAKEMAHKANFDVTCSACVKKTHQNKLLKEQNSMVEVWLSRRCKNKIVLLRKPK